MNELTRGYARREGTWLTLIFLYPFIAYILSMHPSHQEGVLDALEKFAARRGMREIMQAVRGGNLGRANQLATTPGVLKPSWGGSQIRDLGGGGEGLATLVAHPQHGVAVRKMFDPTGPAYSPAIIQRKEQLGNLPGTAKLLGAVNSPQGSRVHFNEYVAGKSFDKQQLQANPDLARQYMQSLRQAKSGGRQAGYNIQDLRPMNAVQQANGQVKFIDMMPFRNNEVYSNAVARKVRQTHGSNIIPARDSGMSLLSGNNTPTGYNSAASSRNPGLFKHYQFTGQMPQNGGLPTMAPLQFPSQPASLPQLPSLPLNPQSATPQATAPMRRPRAA